MWKLRGHLRDANQATENLDATLQTPSRFEDADLFTDPEALASLHEDMVNRLKRLEFGLRREGEGEQDRRATLTGGDNVPEGYRRLVEEY